MMNGDATAGTGRKSFQRQPARAILVDFSPPLEASSCQCIHEALSSTLTLLHHLQGPHRLPLVSIIVLGNYPECILPLQPVKGNFSRVLTALSELKSLSVGALCGRGQVRGCLLEGLQEALVQFKRLSQSSKQGGSGTSSEFPSQIEITLITAQSPTSLRNLIERIADQLDMVHLRKITAIVVTNPDKLVGQESPDCVIVDEGSQGEKGDQVLDDSHMATSISDLAMNILDISEIDNDSQCLQSMFRCWLHDCGTDSEHLHLILPTPPPTTPLPHPPSTARKHRGWSEGMNFDYDSDEGDDIGGDDWSEGVVKRHGGRNLVVKCDIQERILDPFTAFDAKISNQFSLHVSPPTPQPPQGGGRGTLPHPTLPTYKLRAIFTVPAEGVCESIVFGVPLVLRPTSCWKLEWEELESNQQHFHAFCKILAEKNHVVVAQGEHTPPPLTPYFLVLPAPSMHTLLVKPVAPGELLLPSDLLHGGAGPEEQPGGAARRTVEDAFDMLEHQNCYNPLLVKSGFHEVLSLLSRPSSSSSKRGSTRPSGRGRGTSKPTFQPPSQVPPSRRGGSSSGRGRGGAGASGGRSLGTNRRGFNKGYLDLRQ